jgi:hypothetical protein
MIKIDGLKYYEEYNRVQIKQYEKFKTVFSAYYPNLKDKDFNLKTFSSVNSIDWFSRELQKEIKNDFFETFKQVKDGEFSYYDLYIDNDLKIEDWKNIMFRLVYIENNKEVLNKFKINTILTAQYDRKSKKYLTEYDEYFFYFSIEKDIKSMDLVDFFKKHINFNIEAMEKIREINILEYEESLK